MHRGWIRFSYQAGPEVVDAPAFTPDNPEARVLIDAPFGFEVNWIVPDIVAPVTVIPSQVSGAGPKEQELVVTDQLSGRLLVFA